MNVRLLGFYFFRTCLDTLFVAYIKHVSYLTRYFIKSKEYNYNTH
jgi:hypothetical protein